MCVLRMTQNYVFRDRGKFFVPLKGEKNESEQKNKTVRGIFIQFGRLICKVSAK